jgi:hypothetical protein
MKALAALQPLGTSLPRVVMGEDRNRVGRLVSWALQAGADGAQQRSVLGNFKFDSACHRASGCRC